MSLERLAFSYEICKIAREKSKRKKGLGAAFLATAPMAAAQAAGDFPKGYVDKKVNVAVSKGIKPAIKAKAWRLGTGRAAGRLVAGTATAPVFFSGIKDIKEGDRKKGYAKVLAASGAYSMGKGGIEAAVDSGKKITRRQLLKNIGSVGGTRGLLGLGSGVITAASIAEAQKKSSRLKKGRKKQSKSSRFAIPAAIGAGIGGVKGGIEGLTDARVAKKTLRSVGGSAAGRAASGVIGALAISEIARSLSKKEKKASVNQYQQPSQIPTTSQIYSQTRSAARNTPSAILEDFTQSRKNAEVPPTRRAVTYAVNDELRHRGVQVQRERVRRHTYPPQRGEPVKKTSIAHTAAVAAVVASPALVWSLGISKMETPQKDMAIKDALDRLAVSEGLQTVNMGLDMEGVPRFDKPSEAFSMRVTPEIAEMIEGAHATSSEQNRIMAGDMADKARSKGHVDIVSTKKRPLAGILAHEIGHGTADELRRKTIGSSKARKFMKYSTIPAVAIPLVVLDSASDRSFHTREEMEAKAKFVERVGLVSLLLGAPGVAEEGVASFRGLQHLQRVGATPEQLARAAAKMTPGFLSYAAPFATAGIVAKILRSRPTSRDSR